MCQGGHGYASHTIHFPALFPSGTQSRDPFPAMPSCLPMNHKLQQTLSGLHAGLLAISIAMKIKEVGVGVKGDSW